MGQRETGKRRHSKKGLRKTAKRGKRRTKGGGFFDRVKSVFSFSKSSQPSVPPETPSTSEEEPLVVKIVRDIQQQLGLSFQEARELHEKAMTPLSNSLQFTEAQVRLQALLGFTSGQMFDGEYRDRLETLYNIYKSYDVVRYVPVVMAAVNTFNDSMDKTNDMNRRTKSGDFRLPVYPKIQ